MTVNTQPPYTALYTALYTAPCSYYRQGRSNPV